MHVLGTPPAFVLSQDQTLKKLYLKAYSSKIKVLNNLLIAFITQEFSLAVFVRLYTILKQSILIVQGVICSSLRYSIYKVHPLPARRLACLFYHAKMLLSSIFFTNFQKNFGVFFKTPIYSVLVIRHRQLSRIRRRFYSRQPRKIRRYPRPETRRSCAPAGSSGGSLPHGS